MGLRKILAEEGLLPTAALLEPAIIEGTWCAYVFTGDDGSTWSTTTGIRGRCRARVVGDKIFTSDSAQPVPNCSVTRVAAAIHQAGDVLGARGPNYRQIATQMAKAMEKDLRTFGGHGSATIQSARDRSGGTAWIIKVGHPVPGSTEGPGLLIHVVDPLGSTDQPDPLIEFGEINSPPSSRGYGSAAVSSVLEIAKKYGIKDLFARDWSSRDDEGVSFWQKQKAKHSDFTWYGVH